MSSIPVCELYTSLSGSIAENLDVQSGILSSFNPSDGSYWYYYVLQWDEANVIQSIYYSSDNQTRYCEL